MDLVGSIDGLPTLDPEGSRATIKFEELRGFEEFYDEFVSSHSSLLRMQADVARFLEALRKVHARVAKFVVESDSSVYRVTVPNVLPLTEKMYAIDQKRFSVQRTALFERFRRVVSSEVGGLGAEPVLLPASLEQAERWIESTRVCPARVTFLLLLAPAVTDRAVEGIRLRARSSLDHSPIGRPSNLSTREKSYTFLGLVPGSPSISPTCNA